MCIRSKPISVLLFKLRNVPDDEADEIRQLLADNNIDFYETVAGSWGISMPAIWLNNDSQLEKAKLLLDTYQQQRQKNARQDYEQLRQLGKQRTVIDKVKEAPLLAAMYLVAVLFILYISIAPFMNIFR
ncbi:MAG: DUF6164 family protein [Mariprofundaceae bacterium]